ncbi:MAG: hypothetical protein GF315_01150 [candidate division Zixibacteria bacterium]|nr:hypothetical protein [candidate division Zixibacteria bacterium]
MKFTVDLETTDNLRMDQMGHVLESIRKVFPKFDEHKCCADEWSGYTTTHSHGDNIDLGNAADDTPHLLEHMILETIGTIGNLKSISGITCGFYDPPHRYDVFIQCPYEKLGIFALNFCLRFMKKLIKGKKPIKLFGKFTDIRLRNMGGLQLADSRPSCEKIVKDFTEPPIQMVKQTD